MYILAQKLNEKHSKSLDTTAPHPVVLRQLENAVLSKSHTENCVVKLNLESEEMTYFTCLGNEFSETYLTNFAK